MPGALSKGINMAFYKYQTMGVCSQEIRFEIDEQGRLHQVCFIGGCPGNLSAISKLTEGADAAKIAALLSGNDCGGRGTSCADQLARAIGAALEKETSK